jgi:hypothetical protein
VVEGMRERLKQQREAIKRLVRFRRAVEEAAYEVSDIAESEG